MIRDLSDEEARRALPCKWGQVDEGVIPAWVAEMDYALASPIAAALQGAVAAGVTGYPDFALGGPLGEAYAGFAMRHFGHGVDPTCVIPVVDVTAGVRLALDALSEDAPVVMTVPGYPPLLDVAGVTGRERVDLVVDPDAERAEWDLDELDRLLAAGARTVLLTNPHNPWGRVFTRTELEGIRDVVVRRGARVIADEIHAPLVLPGSPAHVPYLSLDGTADHAVALVAASKAFNVAGLRCAQLLTGDTATRDRLRGVVPARNDSWSPLGVVAAVAAYDDGDAWLAALVARLGDQRDLLGRLLAEHLPEARTRPLEATYLAWVDLRAYGHDDPAAVALERGRVRLAPGHDYHPGLTGHVRINIATSPERLTAIVERVAGAL
ncbi:MAG: aminotransferase class I/II-fold pyridoxal phosphate-dependent enzyme [Nocardioidaceae bacterium]|nr:aminotransferase class I/II-fold pyridoxal phosphate-dependent enzyme [Nocardioidaceae bacterium]MCL2614749.1 aminotransferase class I/II-fold pyridoxal phosphate-dependent enzyme [Nocardioidaceae bacterium]